MTTGSEDQSFTSTRRAALNHEDFKVLMITELMGLLGTMTNTRLNRKRIDYYFFSLRFAVLATIYHKLFLESKEKVGIKQKEEAI